MGLAVSSHANLAPTLYSDTEIWVITNAVDFSSEGLTAIMESLHLSQTLSQAVIYTTRQMPKNAWAGQVIPCRTVWGREGKLLAAGIILQEEIKPIST